MYALRLIWCKNKLLIIYSTSNWLPLPIVTIINRSPITSKTNALVICIHTTLRSWHCFLSHEVPRNCWDLSWFSDKAYYIIKYSASCAYSMYLFSLNHLINSITHEHACKILNILIYALFGFVWFAFYIPINNFSVMRGQICGLNQC